MNRKQRRIAAKVPYHQRPEFLEVNVPPEAGIPDGDKFTISGHRREKDGTIITNCAPGTETVFTARVNPK